MSEHLRVALLIESSRGYGRTLLQGIAAYGRTHGHWAFFHEERELDAPLPKNLKLWRPDGIIARLRNDRLLRQVREMRVPTVNLSSKHTTSGIPSLTPDNAALVGLAVDHFLERGFRHFAYCGLPGVPFSDLRAGQFQEALAAHGFRADRFRGRQLPRNAGLAKVEAYAMRHSGELAGWLRGLPKPLALLACNDMRGQQLVTVCEQAEIAVPDEVAVLGIDNDDVQCELCNPPLSSVDPNVEQISYEAASLLDRMMRGEPPPQTHILVPPRGVVTRRSTDVLAVPDRDVAAAIRFVREHACEPGIEIEDILGHLEVSRATLKRWFRKWLGRSPRAEINRVRLNRVQDLLAATALPLDEIALRCGFEHVESMCRMVKRSTGHTAGEYRKALSSK